MASPCLFFVFFYVIWAFDKDWRKKNERFYEKNGEKVWRIQKNVVTLHSQSRNEEIHYLKATNTVW